MSAWLGWCQSCASAKTSEGSLGCAQPPKVSIATGQEAIFAPGPAVSPRGSGTPPVRDCLHLRDLQSRCCSVTTGTGNENFRSQDPELVDSNEGTMSGDAKVCP